MESTVAPEFLLVDLEGDFIVAGAETEAELLPHALEWARDEEYTPGGLVIYQRKSLIEV